MAEMEDIETAKVIVSDDIASASPAEAEKRCGVAGIVYVFKIAGAAAEAGHDLAKVTELSQRAADNCRTIGVALSSCTVPQAGKPTFEIAEDETEIGMGIHGEPGVWRGKLKPVDQIVDELVTRLMADMPINQDDRISILVNGAGATPIEEL
jgi:dihydroxyacetone kinase-like protein